MNFDPQFRRSAHPVSPDFLGKLDALRDELADLAFVLEQRGRIDAADIALVVSSRLAMWREEWARGDNTVVISSVDSPLVRNRLIGSSER